ncbi:hypothetical protein BJY00DRAFT_293090 [Aspergillus carlsbadensis]|nr:hypothetical protein BJY00DRAFT_293090 [Aspergillus carlsbadensis]
MEKSQSPAPLSPDEQARLAPAAFTTLPVQINQHDQEARKTSSRYVQAWRVASQQSSSSNRPTVSWETLGSSSPVGHLASLVYPDCRLELLVFLAKVFDYAQIHHEIVQPVKTGPGEILSTPESNPHLEATLEPEAADTLAAILSPNPAYKRLQLSLASELMEVYEDTLQSALDSASVAVNAFRANARGACESTTFDEYVLRQVDLAKALSSTLLLEVDPRPTPAELACAEGVLAPLRVAQALALEYFSHLNVEDYGTGSTTGSTSTSSSPSSLPVGSVTLLMAQHSVSKEEALAILRQKVVAAEEDHGVRFRAFSEDTAVPENVRRYVEMMRLATGGLHVWASCTPRYQRKVAKAQDVEGSGMRVASRELLSSIWQHLRFGFGFTLLCLGAVLFMHRTLAPSSGFSFYG